MSQQTVEEYLETINDLEETGTSPVKTSSLARVMEVSPASVTEMLRRLAEKGMVDYTPYGGVNLKEKGREYVMKLTRRHRLWEVFLNRHLGYGWDEVYEDACKLEHNTSDKVAEKLAQFLGQPDTCPHGSPIPKKNQKVIEKGGMPLAELEAGRKAKILRVTNENNPKFLHYLSELGMTPGIEIEISEKASFDGTLTIRVKDCVRAVSPETASNIIVEPLD